MKNFAKKMLVIVFLIISFITVFNNEVNAISLNEMESKSRNFIIPQTPEEIEEHKKWHENLKIQSKEETLLEFYVDMVVLILITVIILVILWKISKKINSVIRKKIKEKRDK